MDANDARYALTIGIVQFTAMLYSHYFDLHLIHLALFCCFNIQCFIIIIFFIFKQWPVERIVKTKT